MLLSAPDHGASVAHFANMDILDINPAADASLAAIPAPVIRREHACRMMSVPPRTAPDHCCSATIGRGDFPNWWTRIGFAALSGHYQRTWHRRAHARMSLLAHHGSVDSPRRDPFGLTHQGVDVTFTYPHD